MKNLKFKKTFFTILFLLIIVLIQSDPAPAKENNTNAVQAYNRYLQSYNEFKKAVEINSDELTIEKLSERCKQDLETYKALTAGSAPETANETTQNQAASETAKAQAQGIQLSELEKTIEELYSPDAKYHIDEIIKKLKTLSSSAKSAAEAERAKLEIGNAYITKKDYKTALGLLEAISGNTSSMYRETAQKSIDEIKYLQKKNAMKEEVVRSCNEVGSKKLKVETSSGISKINARLEYYNAILKYKNAIACYNSFSATGQQKTLALTEVVKSVFTKGLSFDPLDPAYGAVLQDQNITWSIRQRPAVLLNKEGAIYKLGNVRWGFDMTKTTNRDKAVPIFRATTVNVEKIKNIYFIIKPFPPEWIAAHCLYIFEFSDDEAVISEQGERSSGFALSIEARLKYGENYSLVQGQFGKFFNIYQLSTKDDYIQSTIMENKKLLPYKLKLTQEQKKTLITNCIEAALKNREIEKYNTLENNCTNNLFLLMNSVLPEKQQFSSNLLFGLLYNYTISFPRTADKVLKKHGVVAETMPVWPTAGEIAKFRINGTPASENTAWNIPVSTLLPKIDHVKNSLLTAINEGKIDNIGLQAIFCSEIFGTVTVLNIPGTMPFERNNGEFYIDDADFKAKLAAMTNSQQLAKYVSELFDDYKASVVRRAAMNGPDISYFIQSDLDRIAEKLNK